MPVLNASRNFQWLRESANWFHKRLPIFPLPNDFKFIFFGTISAQAKDFYDRYGYNYYEELEVSRIFYDDEKSFDYFIPYLSKLNRIALPQFTDLYRQVTYFGVEDDVLFYHSQCDYARFTIQAPTGSKLCDTRTFHDSIGYFNVCKSCFSLGKHYDPLSRIYEIDDLTLIDSKADYFDEHICGSNWDGFFEGLRLGNFTYDYFERYKFFDIDCKVCHCCYRYLIDNLSAITKREFFNHCMHCYTDIFFDNLAMDEDDMLLIFDNLVHTRKYTPDAPFPKCEKAIEYRVRKVKRNLEDDFNSVWLDCKRKKTVRHVPSLYSLVFQTIVNNKDLPTYGKWITQSRTKLWRPSRTCL